MLIAGVIVNAMLAIGACAATYWYMAILPNAVGFESTVLIGIVVLALLLLLTD